MLPIDREQSNNKAMVFIILLVVFVVAAASYYIMNAASTRAPVVAESMGGQISGPSVSPSAPPSVSPPGALSQLTSISQASVKSDKSGSLVSIDTATGVASDQQQNLMDDVMFATKGDGVVRDVKVDGTKMDSALVKLAMFDNHDFMPRDEFPQQDKKARYETDTPPQRSHFGKMTYPLVWSGGVLVSDQM